MPCINCEREHPATVPCHLAFVAVDGMPDDKIIVTDGRKLDLDPKGVAGSMKPQLQLIPPAFSFEVAKALECGAKKYGPWNWRHNKVEMMTYLAAMKRHIDKIIDREDLNDLDEDSAAHHLGHVAAGCAIVLDALKHGTLVDNRPPSTLDPTKPHDRSRE